MVWQGYFRFSGLLLEHDTKMLNCKNAKADFLIIESTYLFLINSSVCNFRIWQFP